jgi:Bbp16-like protein
MFIDALLQVADDQAVTATAVSTNSIDLGVTGGALSVSPPFRQIGTGEPIGFGVQIDVSAFLTSGDETYLFEVISTTDAALSAGLVVLESRQFTAAQVTALGLVAGTYFFLEIPMGQPVQRYLGMRVTTAGTTPAITYSAWLTARKLFSIQAAIYAKNWVA